MLNLQKMSKNIKKIGYMNELNVTDYFLIYQKNY